MANTPTRRLRLTKQEQFSNINTWGEWLNAALDLVDAAFGTIEVAVNGNVTLTSVDFLPDQSRTFSMILTGAGGFTVTSPAVDKVYLVDNRCPAQVTVRPLGGTGVVIPSGTVAIVFSNPAGDTFWAASLMGSRSGAHASAFGNRIKNLGAAVDDTDAIQKVQAVTLIEPYATAAAGSAADALASEVAAADSEAAAADSAVLAQAWAENPEDTPVVPGGYSARHYAAKSEASALAAQLWDPSNYYTIAQVDAIQRGAFAYSLAFGGQ